jgi:hypothetical protein
MFVIYALNVFSSCALKVRDNDRILPDHYLSTEPKFLPWFALVQTLQREQDLASLTPK